MRPLATLTGLWIICTNAMYTDTFLQAFNRLGLSQWDGIEQDIAWGHATSLMGLLRPSIDGPIFVYRAPCRIEGQSPRRVRVVTTTTSGPEPILLKIWLTSSSLSHGAFSRLIPPEEGRGIGSSTTLATSWLTFVLSVPLDSVHMDSLR